MSVLKHLRLLPLLGLVGLLSSCDDIIEPNITKETVRLLTPADTSVSASTVQTFRWEAVEGARQYHIQVASPTLDNPIGYFLDSVTTTLSFATSLQPGKYNWRVQAVNSAYTTAYTTRTFRIDSTGNLAGQQFLLLQPTNNSVTNTTTVTFAWAPLPMAERYILTLTPSPRGTAASFDTLLTSASVSLRVPKTSRTYRWKVTALNSQSIQASTTQSVEVDVTAPTASVFSSPNEGSFFLGLPISLSWNRSGADVIRDSVYLYRADKQTLVTSFPRAAVGTSLTLTADQTDLLPGTYYWALRSVDKAGNRSILSGLRSFLLQ